MNFRIMIRRCAVFLICTLFLIFPVSSVYAETPDLFAQSGLYPNLTASDSPVISKDYLVEQASLTADEPDEQKTQGLSFHTISGYATLALVAGTAISSSQEDLHESMGYGAAAMAALSCITGYMEYGDYFDTDEGFSKYNVHIVSAAVGTAGFILTALLGSDDKEHGAIGGISAAAMIIPVISLKW